MMKLPFQRGFAIISALFILIVLALLGAFVINISGAQHIGSAQDLLGSRAYQAARAGIEWGAYRQQQLPSSCVGATNLAMPATASTLVGISVTVACNINTGVVRIISTACNQPDAGGACPNTTNPTELYVERQVEVFLLQ